MIVADDFMMVEVGLIAPLETNPRKSFPEQSMRELELSIKAHGVIQPLVVRAAVHGFDLVAGERRWRCAQRAGLEMVPCVLKELTDLEVAEIQLIENIDRHQLSALEESAGVCRLVELGLDPHELARKIARTDEWVQLRLELPNLPSVAIEAMTEDKFGIGVAKELLRIDSGQREEATQRLLELEGGLTASTVADLLRSRYHEPRRRREMWQKLIPEMQKRFRGRAAAIEDIEQSYKHVHAWGEGIGHWVNTDDEVGGLSRHPAESVISWGELAAQHDVPTLLVCAGADVCLDSVVEIIDKRVVVDAERALREQGKVCTLGPRKQSQIEADEEDLADEVSEVAEFEQIAVRCVARAMLARAKDEELLEILTPVLLASEIQTAAGHLIVN